MQANNKMGGGVDIMTLNYVKTIKPQVLGVGGGPESAGYYLSKDSLGTF
jgi:hypothetical protein